MVLKVNGFIQVVFCDPKAKKCTVLEVEQQIKLLTDRHATGDQFISSQALLDAMCLISEISQLWWIPGWYDCILKICSFHFLQIWDHVRASARALQL